MSNQHTKKRVAVPDPNFPQVMLGPSNEELVAKQEEIERQRRESGLPKVEFGTDAEDKKMEGWSDIDYDPLGLTDPLAQLKKDYQRPGFALKLLSPDVMNRIGARGYQIVKDENGDAVHSGKMVLGEIPERIAKGRQKAVAIKTKEELSLITETHRHSVDRLKTEARDMGLTVLETGDKVDNIGDRQSYDIGITVERDEQRP